MNRTTREAAAKTSQPHPTPFRAEGATCRKYVVALAVPEREELPATVGTASVPYYQHLLVEVLNGLSGVEVSGTLMLACSDEGQSSWSAAHCVAFGRGLKEYVEHFLKQSPATLLEPTALIGTRVHPEHGRFEALASFYPRKAPREKTIARREEIEYPRPQEAELVPKEGKEKYEDITEVLRSKLEAVREEVAATLAPALRRRLATMSADTRQQKEAIAAFLGGECHRFGLAVCWEGMPWVLEVEQGHHPEVGQFTLRGMAPEGAQVRHLTKEEFPEFLANLQLMPEAWFASLPEGAEQRLDMPLVQALHRIFPSLPTGSRERLAAIDELNQVYRRCIRSPLQEAVQGMLQAKDGSDDFSVVQGCSQKINKVLGDLNFAIRDPETNLLASVIPHRRNSQVTKGSFFRLHDKWAGKDGRRHKSGATKNLSVLEVVDASPPSVKGQEPTQVENGPGEGATR